MFGKITTLSKSAKLPDFLLNCSLQIRPNDWSEEAIKRFKSLVKQYPVYVEFQAITQMGGHMCSDIMLFVRLAPHCLRPMMTK